MNDWDQDSPRLRRNLAEAFRLIEQHALSGAAPSLDAVKQWHRTTMDGLKTPHPSVAGNFRGDPEAPYLACDVEVAGQRGTPHSHVAQETESYLAAMKRRCEVLDRRLSSTRFPRTEKQVDDVIEFAAWAHAEWVRIHPFVNGNGRTARMWANWALMRYGIPPFVRLRPRPERGYGNASAEAMRGDFKPTVLEFREMLQDWLAQPS